MSDRREDEEPVSIEADVPEADWIEQHQPVSDEDDAEVYATEAREHDDAVSIESDTPEADWIEQHQPIVEAGDAEFVPSDAGEREQDWTATDEDVGPTTGQDLPTPPAAAGGRGCNLVAAVARAVLRRPPD